VIRLHILDFRNFPSKTLRNLSHVMQKTELSPSAFTANKQTERKEKSVGLIMLGTKIEFFTNF